MASFKILSFEEGIFIVKTSCFPNSIRYDPDRDACKSISLIIHSLMKIGTPHPEVTDYPWLRELPAERPLPWTGMIYHGPSTTKRKITTISKNGSILGEIDTQHTPIRQKGSITSPLQQDFGHAHVNHLQHSMSHSKFKHSEEKHCIIDLRDHKL